MAEIESIKKLNCILESISQMQYFIYKTVDETKTKDYADFGKFTTIYYNWKNENPQYAKEILGMEKELGLDVNAENIKQMKEDVLEMMLNINNE